jgi:hypothetical protein
VCLIFVETVHGGTCRAYFFSAPERGAEYHSNRNPDAQPDRNVPGQHTGNCAQCRAQRDA